MLHQIRVTGALMLFAFGGSGLNAVSGPLSAPLPGLSLARLVLTQAGSPIVSNGQEGPPGHASGLSPVLPFAVATTNLCFAEINGDDATDFASADAQALRDALAAVSPGGTVRVAGTCAGAVLEGGDTQVALVTKTITLIGGYTQTNWMDSLPITQPTTLDALGGGRVLSFAVGIDGNIAELVLQNGSVLTDGGAVYVFGTLALTNAIFISNTAVKSGGAVFVLGPVTLSGGLFQHNRISHFYGGAGLYGNDTMSLTATRFISNYADGSGGGAFVLGTATLTGGLFQDNYATASGGGIVAMGTLIATDTTFVSNTARFGGGGAYSHVAIDLTGGLYQANRAEIYYGGGLLARGDLSASEVRFIGNSAPQFGAGAYVSGTVTLDGGFLQNNVTPGKGGGLYAESAVAITDSVFVSNSAQNGGGVYLNRGGLLNGGRFERNLASGVFSNGPMDISGTLFVSNTGRGARIFGDANVAFASFVGNEGGGALFKTANVTHSTFMSNVASNSSGGGAMFYGPSMIFESAFVGNVAQSEGGGGALFYGPAIVTNSAFSGNAAQVCSGGGALFYGPVTVTNNIFAGNAAQDGGGAYFNGDYGSYEMSLENNVFARNIAYMHGAEVYAQDVFLLRMLHTTLGSIGMVSNEAVYVSGGLAWFTNTLVSNHAIGIQASAGTAHEDYSLFAGIAAPYLGSVQSGGHSITGTAGFVDPANDDYHLAPGSAAINAGVDAGVFTDFDGDPRPIGGRFDIGFDESLSPPRGYLPLVRR